MKNIEIRTDCEHFEPKRWPHDCGDCQTDGHYLCGNCQHIASFESMELSDNRMRYYEAQEKKAIEKEKTIPCPEFPYFGAKYPDATCVDGFLWDLDDCDENGLLSSGDNPPCPFCNTDAFIEHIVTIDDDDLEQIKKDTETSESEKSEIINDGITKEQAIKIVEGLKNKYSIKKTTE